MQWKRWLIGFMVLGYFLTLMTTVIGRAPFVNSPDEQANLLFAQEFALEQDFLLEMPEVPYLAVVGPRSMKMSAEGLVPGSFLGLPLMAGVFAWCLGDWAIYMVTPLLALLAIFSWYWSVRNIFQDEKLARISAFLLAVFPGFWFYAGRVMMHNVGFVSFLLMATALLSTSWKKSSWQLVASVLGGILIAGALLFRLSELPWVVGVSFGLFIWRRFSCQGCLKKDLFAWGGFALGMAGVAYLHYQVYGNWYLTGYSFSSLEADFLLQESSYSVVSSEVGLSSLQKLFVFAKNSLLPFGLHEKAILRHVWQYLILLYPWFTLPALIGIGVVIKQWKQIDSVKWRGFFAVFLFISGWLFVLYGSWSFHDNPDIFVISLGNSYVRYWLPVFTLLTIPFAFLLKLLEVNRGKGFLIVIILLLIGGSGYQVFWGTDGFLHIREALVQNAAIEEKILSSTKEEDVIIVDYADKFLADDRLIVTPLREETTYQAMPYIVEDTGLYYYGITFPEEDMTYLNTEKLAGLGLQIEQIWEFEHESLYEIRKAE